jgi:indolepyruvate ferredoxin oxidoreductase, beta subunit
MSSNKPQTLNVVIIGVGGQGTLLASRVLGGLAMNMGYDVKVSEVHGMSQRGGSVITYVRMGSEVYAPLVEQKGADFILAFEELEALRALPYLKDGGTMIMNAQRIMPLPVLLGAAQYPENVADTIAASHNVVAYDALDIARKAGNERALNTVLIGSLAAKLPFDKNMWVETLRSVVPKKYIDANLAAFELGYSHE